MKKIVVLLCMLSIVSVSEARVTTKDVLTVKEGKYYLEGKPFAEISFNKFDLFWSLWAETYAGRELNDENPVVVRQRKALSDLRKAGFKTIRFFGLVHESSFAAFKNVYLDPVKREKVFYQAMDRAIDLLEEHNMKAVYSLGVKAFSEYTPEEHLRELVADPQSKSRQFMNRYLDDVVSRYRDSKAILMWEVTNELTLFWDIQPGTLITNGRRCPTMQQGVAFYKEVIARVKKKDPIRMVSNGGSMLREQAYNLNVNKKWAADTYEEHLEAYRQVYEGTGLGVVDIHYYTNSKPGYQLNDGKGETLWLNLPVYMKIAQEVNLPLYVGEYGALPKAKKDMRYWKNGAQWFLTFGNDEADAVYWVQRAADLAVESGAMLIHWWCYQSDRPMDQRDPQRMDLDIERTPMLFNIVVDANRRLKEKLGVD